MKYKVSIIFTTLAIVAALLPVFVPSMAIAGPIAAAIFSITSLVFSILSSKESDKKIEALEQEVKDNKPVFYMDGDTLVLGTAKNDRRSRNRQEDEK